MDVQYSYNNLLSQSIIYDALKSRENYRIFLTKIISASDKTCTIRMSRHSGTMLFGTPYSFAIKTLHCITNGSKSCVALAHE